MAHRSTVLTILVFCLFASCQEDVYELQEDENGRTIRLNKQTGEVAVVGSDTLQILKSTDELEAIAEAEELALAALREAKTWPNPGEIQPIGVDEARLITSWRDGKLYYQLRLTPVPKDFNTVTKSSSYFNVNFQDSGNFNVLVLNIYLSQFSRTIDTDGTPLSINVNSSVTCSKEDYEMIQSWSPQWNF